MRIKEQETRLTLQEHDDYDDDVTSSSFFLKSVYNWNLYFKF